MMGITESSRDVFSDGGDCRLRSGCWGSGEEGMGVPRALRKPGLPLHSSINGSRLVSDALLLTHNARIAECRTWPG